MKQKLALCMLTAAFIAVTFQGCSGFNSAGAGENASQSTDAGLEAFQNTIYAFANSQGCVQCHAQAVQPFFASPNLQTAYQQAETIVNFADPSASVFIINSGNAHCGIAVCESTSAPAEVTSLLEQWAVAENSSGSGGGTTSGQSAYVTATIPLPSPSTIPLVTAAKATPVMINFQLSQLQPAVSALSNAIFQMQVLMDNPTTYKFMKPTIGGNTSAVTVSGIHIFIRPSGTTSGIGTEGSSPQNAWNSVTNATAAILSITSTNPTTAIGGTPLTTTDLFVQEQSAADSITIGFDSITGN